MATMQRDLRAMFQRASSDAATAEVVSPQAEPLAEAAPDEPHTLDEPHMGIDIGSDDVGGSDDRVDDDGGVATGSQGFSMKTMVVITHSDGTRGVAVNVTTVQGVPFLQLKKSVKVAAALLSGWGGGAKPYNALHATDLFERIRSLRDAEVARRISVAEPLPMRNKQRVERLRFLQLPDVISISAPSLPGVHGMDMQVLVAKKSTPVHVELTLGTITYLRSAIIAQATVGDVFNKRKHYTEMTDREVVNVKGISREYSHRQCYRCLRVDSGAGKKKYYTTQHMDRAMTFMESGVRHNLREDE